MHARTLHIDTTKSSIEIVQEALAYASSECIKDLWFCKDLQTKNKSVVGKLESTLIDRCTWVEPRVVASADRVRELSERSNLTRLRQQDQ